jgi:hypothetical protein
MRLSKNSLLAFVACGLAGGAASVASAQPFKITISGATLQEAFFTSRASVNDFCDFDGDGLLGPDADNLAPFDLTPPFSPNKYWAVEYRAVGSGNGIRELVEWGGKGDNGPYALTITDLGSNVDTAYIDGVPFIDGSVLQPDADPGNPGASPLISLTDGTYAVSTGGAGTGTQIDLAPSDVPVAWFRLIETEADADPDRRPNQPGYGNNPRLAVMKDGSPDTRTNKLLTLGNLNTDLQNPDACTLYSTPIAFTPIAYPVNYGVGLQQASQTELRHLFTTGRMITGENLIAVTRDSGSGTRNAAMNSLCLDPSWGIGDNVGPRATQGAQTLVGPDYIPTNKGGSSLLEDTVRNTRLGVGTTGAERGESSDWLIDGEFDLLAIQYDVTAPLNGVVGPTPFVRPTVDNVIDNDPATGYLAGGPAVIAHIGDPLAEPAANGGVSNGNPQMRNQYAAQYMNNITKSIAAFAGAPGADPTLFSPGEFLATQFILVAATDFRQDPLDACILVDARPGSGDGTLNQTLQDFTRTNSVLDLPQFATFGATTTTGFVPTRTTGVTYSDGVPGGTNYIDQAGNAVLYGNAGGFLSARNRISGDFNNDGLRNLDDAAEMIAAYNDRTDGNGLADWQTGTDAVIEILGDFQNDGNFDLEDLRYWADGLAMDPGTGLLDRDAGFTALDTEFGGNLFGTVLATGKPYEAGDSRGDVFNKNGDVARGWAPVGADGIVDGNDIDYVYANFGDWTDLNEAIAMDLSADMNGDLVVNLDDVCVLVTEILGTTFGDVNLDGSVTQDDIDIVNANFGLPGGWKQGDVNGDGTVDQADLDIVTQGPASLCCPADFDGDGTVGSSDLSFLLGNWGAGGGLSAADFDNSGVVDSSDLSFLLNQ